MKQNETMKNFKMLNCDMEIELILILGFLALFGLYVGYIYFRGTWEMIKSDNASDVRLGFFLLLPLVFSFIFNHC